MVNNTPVFDRCSQCGQARDYADLLATPHIRAVHLANVGRLAALPPGTERLVRTLHYLAAVSFGRIDRTGPLRFEPLLPEFYADLAQACPDFWPGGEATVDLLRPPWNSLAVAEWFLNRIRLTGKPPNAKLEGWVTTSHRWHGHLSQRAEPLPAWRFHEGSLTHLSETNTNAIADRRADAYVVVADGRVMRSYDEPCTLGARALVSMGQLLWGTPAKPWD
jgi:hypothetical protein